MRRFSLSLILAVLSSSLIFAHGNEKHVMGTIKAIGPDSISVETTTHQIETVQVTKDTKFVRGGTASTIQELKVGDRVVIHAKPAGDKLEAAEVRSAPKTQATTSKQ
jgi:hypothetical protein